MAHTLPTPTVDVPVTTDGIYDEPVIGCDECLTPVPTVDALSLATTSHPTPIEGVVVGQLPATGAHDYEGLAYSVLGIVLLSAFLLMAIAIQTRRNH